MYLINFKNFCFVKDPVKKMKGQSTELEKMFEPHISQRARIYKECSKIQVKIKNKQFN